MPGNYMYVDHEFKDLVVNVGQQIRDAGTEVSDKEVTRHLAHLFSSNLRVLVVHVVSKRPGRSSQAQNSLFGRV